MNVNPKERTESISIRVTPEEKAALKKLAAAAGMTLTGFLVGEALGEKLGDAIIKSREAKKNNAARGGHLPRGGVSTGASITPCASL